jgi:hypothetical protein
MYFMYNQDCFICRPSDSRVLELNPDCWDFSDWQSDTLNILGLDLIHANFRRHPLVCCFRELMQVLISLGATKYKLYID